MRHSSYSENATGEGCRTLGICRVHAFSYLFLDIDSVFFFTYFKVAVPLFGPKKWPKFQFWNFSLILVSYHS